MNDEIILLLLVNTILVEGFLFPTQIRAFG